MYICTYNIYIYTYIHIYIYTYVQNTLNYLGSEMGRR